MSKIRINQSAVEIKSPIATNGARYLVNPQYHLSSQNGKVVGFGQEVCIVKPDCLTSCCLERISVQPITTNLVSLYTLESNTGQIILDSSENKYNAYLGNSSGSDAFDPTYNSQGLLFGSGSFITVPNVSGALTPSPTLSFAIGTLLTASGGFPNYVLQDSAGSNLGLRRDGSSGENLVLEISSTDVLTANNFFTSGGDFSGVIGFSLTSGGATIYKNGYEFASGSFVTTIPSFMDDLTIGTAGSDTLNTGSQVFIFGFYDSFLVPTEHLRTFNAFKEVMDDRNIIISG